MGVETLKGVKTPLALAPAIFWGYEPCMTILKAKWVIICAIFDLLPWYYSPLLGDPILGISPQNFSPGGFPSPKSCKKKFWGTMSFILVILGVFLGYYGHVSLKFSPAAPFYTPTVFLEGLKEACGVHRRRRKKLSAFTPQNHQKKLGGSRHPKIDPKNSGGTPPPGAGGHVIPRFHISLYCACV